MLYTRSKWFSTWTVRSPGHIQVTSKGYCRPGKAKTQVTWTKSKQPQESTRILHGRDRKAVTTSISSSWYLAGHFPETWQLSVAEWLCSGLWNVSKNKMCHFQAYAIQTSYEQSSMYFLLLANLAEPEEGKHLGCWMTTWQATQWSSHSHQGHTDFMSCHM